MKRQVIIPLLCVVCLLLSTFHAYGFANIKSGAMCCCHKSTSSVPSCCSNPDEKGKENPCNGNCKDDGCKCMSPVLTVFVLKEPVIIVEAIEVSFEKQFLIENETFLSYDFSSIWAPPKIA